MLGIWVKALPLICINTEGHSNRPRVKLKVKADLHKVLSM